MAFESITTEEIEVGDYVTTTTMTKIKDDLDYLYGQGSLLRGSVPNGNFEIDADSDGIPDGWTRILFAAGAGVFDETTPMEGLRTWKFTHPGGNGNGGGYLTSGYLECSEYESYGLYTLHYTSVTGIKDKIQIQYYDKDKVVNGVIVDLYNSSVCDLTPTQLELKFTPPAGSKFLKIILTGGHTDLIAAGSSYFDDISILKAITGAIMPDAAPAGEGSSAIVVSYGTVGETTAETWTTVHSWRINRTGSYTIKFTLTIQKYGTATAYGRIYKNGVAFGTSRSVTGIGGGEVSEVFSENLSFSAGDIIDFKAYMSGQATAAQISGLYFYANDNTFASRIS